MHNIVLAGENVQWNLSAKEELALLLVVGWITLSPKSQCEVEDRIQMYVINFWTQKT